MNEKSVLEKAKLNSQNRPKNIEIPVEKVKNVKNVKLGKSIKHDKTLEDFWRKKSDLKATGKETNTTISTEPWRKLKFPSRKN